MGADARDQWGGCGAVGRCEPPPGAGGIPASLWFLDLGVLSGTIPDRTPRSRNSHNMERSILYSETIIAYAFDLGRTHRSHLSIRGAAPPRPTAQPVVRARAVTGWNRRDHWPSRTAHGVPPWGADDPRRPAARALAEHGLLQQHHPAQAAAPHKARTPRPGRPTAGGHSIGGAESPGASIGTQPMLA